MGGIFSAAPKPEGDAGSAAKAKVKPANVNDPYSIKRQLDDAVTEVVLGKGFKEDHGLSNAKLVLGLAACGVAALAQFYPKKFPENQPLLLACLASYIGLNCVIQYLTYFKEKNHILFTRPPEGSFVRSGMAVSSSLPRFSDMYTLRVAAAGPSPTGAPGAPPSVALTKSVTQWFASDGVMAHDTVKADVGQLLLQYEDIVGKKAK